MNALPSLARRLVWAGLVVSLCFLTSFARAAACVNLAGTWSLFESITFHITQDGQTDEQTQSGTADVQITQRGCNFTIISQVENPITGRMMTLRRHGTVTGNAVKYSGPAALGVPCQPNYVKGSGAVAGQQMSLDVSGLIQCSAGGHSLTVEISGFDMFSTDRTLVFPPFITLQPEKQKVAVGTDVTLSVEATGTGPLNYQWKKNGRVIPDATSPVLNLTNVQKSDTGSYAVYISNEAGRVKSKTARLVVR